MCLKHMHGGGQIGLLFIVITFISFHLTMLNAFFPPDTLYYEVLYYYAYIYTMLFCFLSYVCFGAFVLVTSTSISLIF